MINNTSENTYNTTPGAVHEGNVSQKDTKHSPREVSTIPVVNSKYVSRFWSRVRIDDQDACWIWTGNLGNRGYGRFGAGVSVQAHRYAWLITHGPLTAEQVVCHRCDNTSCVNPRHLFVGSQAENVADMISKERHNHKLSKESVSEIKLLAGAGVPCRTIGRMYGVSGVHAWRLSTTS